MEEKVTRDILELMDFAYELMNEAEGDEAREMLGDVVAYCANLYGENTKKARPVWTKTDEVNGITLYKCGMCGWYEMNMNDNIEYKCPACGMGLRGVEE